MSNIASNSEIDSVDSSFDSSDDDLVELLLITIMYEYKKSSMGRNQIRTSSLTNYEFINKLLNGSPIVYYELFHMDKTCFITFCDNLRILKFLGDSRDVSLEEKVLVTLFIFSTQHLTKNFCRSFSTFD